MTRCTICGRAIPGRDDDDVACCLTCYGANLAGAELGLPPPWRRPDLPRPWHADAAAGEGEVPG